MRLTTGCAALLLLAACGSARAETTECTEITALPYSIVTPGTHCLKRSLDEGGRGAIDVSADDVTVDFNGNTVTTLSFGVRSQIA